MSAASFKIATYIEMLEEPQKTLAIKLIELIHQTVPQVEERFSFKLPFYHYYGMFCYINKVPDGIELVFCRGKDLVLGFPQLYQGERAIMAGVTCKSLQDIYTLELPQILQTAAEWQIESKKMKRPFMHKKSTSTTKNK